MARSSVLRLSRSLRSHINSPCPRLLLPQCHFYHQNYKRSYSTQSSLSSQQAALNALPNIDPSSLTTTLSTTPKKTLPPQDLIFGRTFTDHMLSIEWTSTSGWLPPRITPYQNLSLDPATCVFHYAFECFEGMKAYRCPNGDLRLFRPDKNMARFNKSAARIALPNFDGEALIELIKKFVKLEERFIPAERGFSLYLRPTLIGTQRTLGVGPPGSALLYLIASPVGPYYPTGFKAVSLDATPYAVRAWPGGVGDKKLGANYCAGIVPQLKAAERGFQQNLWLFKEGEKGEEYVTEVGTMNFFAVIRDPVSGKRGLWTAPLDGTILEGVTRDSVLQLARERLVPEGWEVREEKFTMGALARASEEGRLLECFGAGTAAVVSPVRAISWGGRMVGCGLEEGEEAGEVTMRMKGWIEGVQYGDEEHDWSVKI